MVTLISSSASTPKISFDFTKNNVPVSSPSYLISKEDAVVTTKKLMEPSKTLTMNTNPKDDQEIGDEKKMVKKKATEDPEIGVFGAEKYFSGDMDSDQSSSVLSLTNPEVERFVVELKQTEKKSTGTPSVCTESSWNSQSMLLKNKLVNSCNGSVQEKKANSGQTQNNNKKTFLSNLRCKCCSDVNSVDVYDKTSSVSTGNKIENQMSSSMNLNKELIKIQKQEELVHRKSPEVFGSPVNIEKKLTLPPWESRRKEEDTKSEGSDSSSDLFEIDNLTGKPKSFLTRQVSDYAPSEVSIEWSVVTESAAGFSVMSECATSPVRRNRSSLIPKVTTNTNTAKKPNTSRNGGFLLSCKSYKSVMVSNGSDRRSNMNKNKTSPSYVPRFPMETTKPKSLETRRRISNSSNPHTHPSPLYS
ncbi:unnamed protein product [Eruca vesicaria subsp. sativa]|uniref:Phytochrome kinase substrate 1 n=1 Tax=Eruca vesicaria subsp. sativa TaxID=29727 RepID=A0ABC8KA13_ERUVS|nr:unnamed protein product [Eruca vesicaria subsp. sativa]